MPTYVYERPDGSTFEVEQSINEAPLVYDDEGNSVTRILQPFSFKFKGGKPSAQA